MYKLIWSTLFVIFTTNVFADNYHHSTTFGGWSKHFNSNNYNEQHNISGYEYGNNSRYIGAYKFTNSYSDKSYLVALHENFCKESKHFFGLTYCYGLFGGYVSGYEDLSMILSPELVLRYKLTQSFSVGGSVSCLPALCAGMLRLTINK